MAYQKGLNKNRNHHDSLSQSGEGEEDQDTIVVPTIVLLIEWLILVLRNIKVNMEKVNIVKVENLNRCIGNIFFNNKNPMKQFIQGRIG